MTCFLRYGLGLLPLGGIGPLHMALNMAEQNVVSAICAHD